jgi:thiol:disulfide interchange protein
MDIPSASPVRAVLLKVTLAIAFALAAVLLLDCIFHHPILQFVMQLEWPFVFIALMLLAFLLAVLLGELRDMVLPVFRAWSDNKHWAFVAIFCYGILFLMPMFYFIAVWCMIDSSPGGSL